MKSVSYMLSITKITYLDPLLGAWYLSPSYHLPLHKHSMTSGQSGIILYRGHFLVTFFREESRAMFFFSFDNYITHAFPKDELRPISCKGHDSQGGIAITLLDALDTLVVSRAFPTFVCGIRGNLNACLAKSGLPRRFFCLPQSR